MAITNFSIVETVVTIDGKTVATYGIANDRISILDICLEKDKVVTFCKLLNSTGGENDEEILHNLIEDYFA